MLTLWLVLVAALCLQLSAAVFYSLQDIATDGGNDAEFFTIDGLHYMAWANAHGNNSMIYYWNLNVRYWRPYSTLPSPNCQGATSFSIENHTYMVLASYDSPTSPIFKWNRVLQSFEYYQDLEVNQPRKFKFAVINGESYLATAQQSALALIFKWNSGTALFESFQSIDVTNAQGVGFFNTSSNSYFAIANGDSNPSDVYEWNGSEFAFFQSLPGVTEAQSVYGYDIDNSTYLAVASYANTTFIFKWSTASNAFVLLQNIRGRYKNYNDAVPFEMDGVHYLGLAIDGPPPHYHATSAIYIWNGLKYSFFQGFTTWLAQSLTFYTIAGEHYMASTNLLDDDNWNVPAQIFYWDVDA